ncbi:6-phosphogluconolactonase [Alkalibacterium subtropicum]|uniref:6-phosphogluconolactonase n=1 Tax=Alkalibacterium subtropicum TaxID=753702 RepID=A0A1I1HPY1_9LACT|nr:lactonase family protein [Alkalibacterium subtropicum]SFC26147.1 6-phosphogluconolactonase [Alkalibacterium subtropicum]
MTQKIMLGTYTKRTSKGIYSIELDEQKKQLTDLKEEVNVESPTYLAGNEDYSLLFSIAKSADGKGGIKSFSRQAGAETYTEVDSAFEEGAPPCYIAYDQSRNLVYTANYHKGEVAVYQTSEKGDLSFVDKHTHTGKSVHDNQQSPHAHYFDLTPDGQFLIACDLGTDEVIMYTLDEEHKLAVSDVISVSPGTGPRHVVFHPNNRFAYVFGELSSDVIVFSYNSQNGTLSPIQTISTIPKEHESFNGGAAIRVSSDGKFVYASNRGHDSIVIYEVAEDGTLSLVNYTPTEGETPRDFNLDPTERFVVVGHQDSDNLTLFERNKKDGKLTLLQKDIFAPEVICVKFPS